MYVCYTSEYNPLKLVPLYRLWLQSLGHRIFYRLGQNILFVTSFITLSWLFFTISSDFFSQKLSTLDPELTRQANLFFSYAVSVLSFFYIIYYIQAENTLSRADRMQPAPLSHWSLRCGESIQQIGRFRFLRACTVTGVLFSVVVLICFYFFPTQKESWWLWSQMVITVLAFLIGWFWPTYWNIGKSRSLTAQDWSFKKGCLPVLLPYLKMLSLKVQGIIYWKWWMIWSLFPTSRLVLPLTLLAALLLLPVSFLFHPLQLLALASFIGLVTSYSLYAFEADSIRSCGYEKIAGMSHQDYGVALWSVMGGLSLLYFVIIIISLLPASVLGVLTWVMMLKIACISVMPIFMVPCLHLQVDATRPLLNTLMTLLSVLFLGTALLAHFATLLALPFIFFSLWRMGKERFYRA